MVVACSFFHPKQMTWKNRTRKNATQRIPYAYKATDEDPLQLIPDEDYIPFVEQAMDHLDEGYSGRKVTEWLNDKCERTLSHQGLRNIWAEHRPKSKRLKSLKKENKKSKPKTKDAKEEARLRRKIADSKRVKTMMESKLAKHKGTDVEAEEEFQSISDTLDFGVITQEQQEREIVFQPNPGPQTDFLAASEREVLYGGSAGSGKSFALLADPMRYFNNSNFSYIRTNPNLLICSSYQR